MWVLQGKSKGKSAFGSGSQSVYIWQMQNCSLEILRACNFILSPNIKKNNTCTQIDLF